MFITWVNIPMTPYEIVSGQEYAILGEAPGTVSAYSWYFRGNQDYMPGGKEVIDSGAGWVGSSYDLGFRVHVTPEPATLSLLALGCLAVLRRRRKL